MRIRDNGLVWGHDGLLSDHLVIFLWCTGITQLFASPGLVQGTILVVQLNLNCFVDVSPELEVVLLMS